MYSTNHLTGNFFRTLSLSLIQPRKTLGQFQKCLNKTYSLLIHVNFSSRFASLEWVQKLRGFISSAFKLCLISIYHDDGLGHAVAQLIEALRYKPEGRGFDSRCCHWNFSLI
jgi:hypothetical protein